MAMPVGATTTAFFLVVSLICLSNVDFPVPALPVMKMGEALDAINVSADLNSSVISISSLVEGNLCVMFVLVVCGCSAGNTFLGCESSNMRRKKFIDASHHSC